MIPAQPLLYTRNVPGVSDNKELHNRMVDLWLLLLMDVKVLNLATEVGLST